MTRVLLIDDDSSVRGVLAIALKYKGYDVVASSGGDHGRDLASSGEFDVMVSDVRMDPYDGFEMLHWSRTAKPEVAAILLSGMDVEEFAAKSSMHKDAGSFDCLAKPLGLDELLSSIEKAMVKDPAPATAPAGDVVAVSPAMRAAVTVAKKVAPTATAIFLLGESGTGKALLARSIHDQSRRSSNAFTEIDCAAYSEPELIELLFDTDKNPGLISKNDGGTVYIENVNRIGESGQRRMLEFLRGDGENADVRIISSSTVRLSDLATKGELDKELSCRLAPILIAVAPLRERQDDILPLFQLFARKSDHGPEIDTELKDALRARPWPGNATELKDATKAIVAAFKDGRSPIEALKGI